MFWRAIISNSIFWKVRKALSNAGRMHGKDRKQLLKEIIDPDKYTINEEVIKDLLVDPTVFSRTYQIAKKFKGETDAQLFQNNHESIEDFKRLVVDYNFDLFQAVEVAKALLCKKSTWRLKTHKFQDPSSEKEAWEWLHRERDRLNSNEIEKVESNDKQEEFFNNLRKMSLDQFAIELEEMIPNEFDKFHKDDRKSRTKFKIQEVIDLLKKPGSENVKEKMILILYGVVENKQWQEGKTLKNSSIAQQIVKYLLSILTEEFEDKEQRQSLIMHLEETKGFTKHWYRKKGSRKKYGNEKPSFWAITGYTDPWSFFKNDKKAYLSFKENLSSLEKEEDYVKHQFYQKWKHLLQMNPTKPKPILKYSKLGEDQADGSPSGTANELNYNYLINIGNSDLNENTQRPSPIKEEEVDQLELEVKKEQNEVTSEEMAKKEQLIAGISRNFEEILCPKNTATVLLGGTVIITCKDNPLKVKARICRFEEFDQISKKLSDEGHVSSKLCKVCSLFMCRCYWVP